ncbi:MAG: type II toxin-antitoxin system HipA family toxin [Chlamydiota bacterium]
MPARIRRVNVTTVFLWGHEVGAAAWDEEHTIARFEYTDDFLRTGLNIAPLMMPLQRGIFSFPGLNFKTFRGLPGLLSDSLPDRFGNRLIDAWLQRLGRSIEDFTSIERLCYIGTRGMGALEFKPAIGPQERKAIPIEISELTQLAADILRHRTNWVVNLQGSRAEALKTIIRVGSSAGGNRAKAVIAWNPSTHEVRSGQVQPPPGFEPWILKFDGVNDTALGDPKGYGRVEYAYYTMAISADIRMSTCRLLEENGRAHFMTRRFDRDKKGDKIHTQSLCAMAHYDFNAAGEYSYEQAFSVIRRLNLGHETMKEMYRRMVFNVLACNRDDHTKNIEFLMDTRGQWQLSPAFDLTWAFNPAGRWTSRHQMSINGKREGITRSDFLTVAKQTGIKDAPEAIDKIIHAVSQWTHYADEAGVPSKLKKEIARSHYPGMAKRRNRSRSSLHPRKSRE